MQIIGFQPFPFGLPLDSEILLIQLFLLDSNDWALIMARGRSAHLGLIKSGNKLFRRLRDCSGQLIGEEEIDSNDFSLDQFELLLEKWAEFEKIDRNDIHLYSSGEKELYLEKICG